MTAYDQCTSDTDKEKLLSSIRYGRLKRFVEKASNLTMVKTVVCCTMLLQLKLSNEKYFFSFRNLGPALSRTLYQLYCTPGALS